MQIQTWVLRPQMNMRSAEREANEPSELNDMLPKQKHTFVILFPCQRSS